MPAIPPTKAILKRFDPKIFPKSIVYSFFFVREIEAASSGKLVPIATSVNPISSSGTPARDAKFFAPKLMNQSLPIVQQWQLKSLIVIMEYHLVSYLRSRIYC